MGSSEVVLDITEGRGGGLKLFQKFLGIFYVVLSYFLDGFRVVYVSTFILHLLTQKVSHVMCHVSCVTFFTSVIIYTNIYFFFEKLVKLVGGGSFTNWAYPVVVISVLNNKGSRSCLLRMGLHEVPHDPGPLDVPGQEELCT